MTKAINWTEALDGQTHLLESGVDFEHGRDFAVLLDARREAIKRGLPLKMKFYQRGSEVEAENRDELRGRKFPLVVVRAVKGVV